jgi:hypothetical protein
MKTIESIVERRDEIIEEIRNLRSMRKGIINEQYLKVPHKGKEAFLRGPYYVLTKKQNGKTVSTRIRRNEYEEIKKETEAYKKFNLLSSEFATITEELTYMRKISQTENSKKKQEIHKEEFGAEIEKFLEVARGNIRHGKIPAMEDIEEGMREAAHRDGSRALSMLLSEIPDVYEEGVICDTCGREMENLGRREKGIISLLGEGTVSRMYYECIGSECKEHRFPKDELLDIAGTSFSPGVRRLMGKSGSDDAFDKGRLDLKEYSGIEVGAKDVERISESIGNDIEKWQKDERTKILAQAIPVRPDKNIPVLYVECDGTGVPVIPEELEGRKGKQEDGSAKTRESKVGCIFTQTTADEKGHPIRDKNSTTYVGAIETSAEFGERLEAEAIRRGLWNAETVVILGDGAIWVRNLVEQHFCGVIQIVDFYHAKEHLHKLLQLLFDTQEKFKEQEPIWIKWFEDGNIEEIVKTAKQLHPDPKEICKNIEKETGYFEENVDRMRYADYKKKGLFVGSGVIEAGCKTVIGKRLKQSGMRWSVRGADAIIALRCCILSGRFDEYWENRAAV